MHQETYQPNDRRPLASRGTWWSRKLTDWLASAGVSPNAISLAGMAFGCASGAMLAATPRLGHWAQTADWLAAAVAIQLRLLCNLLDGMVAVQLGRASRTGELFNEIPDRISDPVTLIGAGYAVGGLPVLGYVAACLALFTAYIRTVGKAAGARQEYCGPMAKQQRMFVLTIVAVYCGIVPPRWQPVMQDNGAGIVAVSLGLIIIGCVITAARRLVRIYRQLEHLR